MKHSSFKEFFLLLRFQVALLVSWQAIILMISVIILYAIPTFFIREKFWNQTVLTTLRTQDLFISFNVIFYALSIQFFFLNQSMDSKNIPGRFLSESDFTSVLPLRPRSLFYSKITILLGLFSLIYLGTSLDHFKSSTLEILTNKNNEALVQKIYHSLPNSEINQQTNLSIIIPDGANLLLQINLLYPLVLLLTVLALFYFLRNFSAGNLRISLVTLVGVAPVIIFSWMRTSHFLQSLSVNLFIWFSHWRYWVLGGLILALIALILFLGEKAEAREEF